MTMLDSRGALPSHLAALIESSQDGIISKNLDGLIQSWNRGAEQMFGYSANEIIGQSILTLIPQDRLFEEDVIREKLQQGERIEHYETVRRRKDGTMLDVSITVSPIRDDMGKVIGGSKIARDVTDRKRADTIAYHFGAIVKSSQDAIISKSLDGIIRSWNHAAEQLFGYKPHEIIGRPVLDLIPEDRHYEETEILSRIRAGKRVEHFETVRRHKDGSPIQISLTVSPILDAGGQVVGASKIARDIREKIRSDETRELLLNEIKHRVKNTLATVQALAAQTFRSAAPPEHQAFLARIQAMSAAHDLLTQRQWHDASLKDVAEQALKPFCGDAPRLTFSGPAVELNSNKTLLIAMLLHELGTNAVKYGALSNDQGKVALTWDADTSQTGGYVKLHWRESGGPPVAPPTRKGFGTRMIERSLQAENGDAQMAFLPGGLACEITIRL